MYFFLLRNKKFFYYYLIILSVAHNSYASAWLPKKDSYLIGVNIEKKTELSGYFHKKYIEYNNIQNKINFNIALIYQIKNQETLTALPDSTREQRIEIIQKQIDVLKIEQSKIRRYYPVFASNFYVEKGLTDFLSMGASFSKCNTQSLRAEGKVYHVSEFFARNKLYQSKRNFISSKIGIEYFKDYKEAIPIIGIDFSKYLIIRKKIKIINSLNFSYLIDKKLNIKSSAYNTIEHIPTGLSLSVGNILGYNKNYQYDYVYYYKRELKISKKIVSDLSLPLENITISFGIYTEYYTKSLKPFAKGITFGLWCYV